MASEVISRVRDVVIGSYGAAIGACTSVGGCTEVEVITKAKTGFKTDASNNSARVGGYQSEPERQIVFRGCTSITATNMAKVLGATADASGNLSDTGGGGTLTNYAVFVTGLFLGDTERTGRFPKVCFPTDGAWKQGDDPTTFDLTGELLYDSSTSKFWDSIDYSADTTAPTVVITAVDASGNSYSDGATGVPKAATTVIRYTFSEAIRTDDIAATKFFVFDASGNLVAGALTYNSPTNTIVTFTPTSALSASTAHYPTVVGGSGGVRDVAGNALAATDNIKITTGA